MTLTDEAALIRGLSITLVGRLSLLNPAYVMPALRKHLMQLLSDLEHASDHAQKEGFRPPWLKPPPPFTTKPVRGGPPFFPSTSPHLSEYFSPQSFLRARTPCFLSIRDVACGMKCLRVIALPGYVEG